MSRSGPRARLRVSILTDPSGPVLPRRPRRDSMGLYVSILTDPSGPVLPFKAVLRPIVYGMFQSSPTRQGRCFTPNGTAERFIYTRFNPHRPVRAGASRFGIVDDVNNYSVSILTDPSGPVLHGRHMLKSQTSKFQSSPTRQGRCFGGLCSHARKIYRVSILTDPSGPVLHRGCVGHIIMQVVSILTDPSGPVLRPSPTAF